MDRRKVLLAVAAVVAALGTLLVVLYVHGADKRADTRYKAVTVLRAVKPIAAGETVEQAQASGAIQTGTVSQQDLLPGALNGADPIAGQSALTAISPGEQILQTKFGSSAASSALTMPKGMLAISVTLTDPARVAGFVNPGDQVAIFLNGSSADGAGGAGGEYTRMLLPRVQVIAVGATTVTSATQTDATGAQTTGQPAEPTSNTLLTLALNQHDAEKVLFASKAGELAFGLLNADSQVTPSRGIGQANLFN